LADGKRAFNTQESLIAKRRSLENVVKPIRLGPRS